MQASIGDGKRGFGAGAVLIHQLTGSQQVKVQQAEPAGEVHQAELACRFAHLNNLNKARKFLPLCIGGVPDARRGRRSAALAQEMRRVQHPYSPQKGRFVLLKVGGGCRVAGFYRRWEEGVWCRGSSYSPADWESAGEGSAGGASRGSSSGGVGLPVCPFE